MKIKNQFGKRISYKEILSRVVYIENKSECIDIKLTEDSKFQEVVAVNDNWNERTKWPQAYRKLVFDEEYGEGIIIGQTKRSEGKYYPSHPASPPDYDDAEPAVLEIKKTYTFWVVATEMNRTILVPKEQ